MKIRRALGVAVAMAMIAAALLTGCSTAAPAATTQAATSTPVLQATTPAATATTATTATTQQPNIDTSQYVTLKYYDLGDKMPDADKIWGLINDKLKKDINCSVEYTTISWSDFETKYPLIFASGEDFDTVFSAYWCDYSGNAGKGAFAEIKQDDLQKYMPKTVAAVSPAMWAQTKVNGKIYMVPATRPNYTQKSKGVFLVRGDLMAKYGISSIQTSQDMLKYWDAVAKDEPSTGIIPMAVGNSSIGYWGQLVASEFTKDNNIGDTDANHYDNRQDFPYFQVFDITDPQNIKVIDNSAYDMELFKLCREFNQKGYFGADVATQTDQSLTMFENGKSATGFRQLGNVNASYESVMKAHPDWKPMMVDIRPDLPVWSDVATADGISIHATSKNPERAMMMMDLMGYDMSYNNLSQGVEGTDYTVNQDGSFHSIVGADGKAVFKGTNGFMGFDNVLYKDEGRAPNFDSLYNTYVKDNFTPALAAMNFDSSKVNSQISAVSGVETKYLPILCLGLVDDVQGTYNQMMTELKAAGLGDIQAEYLKQAQAFMSTYGK